jgi:small GTP-binding protein
MITISDTAGEDDFSSMRPLSYLGADAFILCYSIDQPDSLKHLRDKWMPEIRHFCPATPILVVGNKKDLRDSSENLVPTKEATEIAKQITNLPLIECSAKTREVILTQMFLV